MKQFVFLAMTVSMVAFFVPQSVFAGPQCTALGGNAHCATFCVGKEVDKGQLDCQGLESCCQIPITAPAPLPGEPGAAPGKVAPAPKVVGGLVLPACVKTGNCTLDDIVRTGVNFANFLLGLSGALFLIIFIYGGAMYMLSFGEKSRVDKGKSAIKGAAIGIIFVIGAWTIVRYIYSAVTPAAAPSVGGAAGSTSGCESKGSGWSCTTLTGATAQEALADAASKNLQCQTGLCPGAANVVCCAPK